MCGAQLAALEAELSRSDGIPATSIRAAGAGDGGRLVLAHAHVDSREITVQRGPLHTLAVLGITVLEVM
jgi:hypothetical protein